MWDRCSTSLGWNRLGPLALPRSGRTSLGHCTSWAATMARQEIGLYRLVLKTIWVQPGSVGTGARAGGSMSAKSTRRYDSTLRRRQAEQNRRTILDSATTLFAERGWAVAVRDIADAAGTSIETIYAHFGSKRARDVHSTHMQRSTSK